MHFNRLAKLAATLLLAMLTAACSRSAPKTADPAWATAPLAVTDPATGKHYWQQQVLIRSGQDDIASVLLTPESGAAPRRAMIWVSGSQGGLEPVDSPLPRRMVDAGYAVLMLGKKGVGASGGDWRQENFSDRAGNVQAAVDWLARQPGIAPQHIGLYGHSQGGYVAALFAARGHGARFAVLAAAPAQTVREQIATDDAYQRMRDEQMAPEAARSRTRYQTWGLDAAMSLCPLARVHYLCGIYHYDPAPDLAAVRIPVLALFGERDTLVPPDENVARMKAALARSGTPYAIEVLPKANHQFWQSVRGTPGEFAELVAGRKADFPFAEAGNPQHQRASQEWGNRALYADRYFEVVLDFIAAH